MLNCLLLATPIADVAIFWKQYWDGVWREG